MKKRSFGTIFTALILTGMLLLSACSNVLEPSASVAGQGKGIVMVSFSAGRAALNPVDTNFDYYLFTFIRQSDGQPFSETRAKDESLSFSLDRTGYKLTVDAYSVINGVSALAAQGVSDYFDVGNLTTVTVKLTGKINQDAEGEFSFNIQYPLGAVIEQMDLWSSEEDFYNLTLPEYSVSGAGDGVNTIVSKPGNLNVASGWYFLIVRLSKDDTYAGYANGVQIIPGQTTPFVKEFNEADFKAPVVPGDGGVQVDEWHGFRIITEERDSDVILDSIKYQPYEVKTRYERYYSGARAISYAIFTDPNDNVYQDVLKLEAPEDGYPNGSMALIYELPEVGKYTYIFCMKVWLEPGMGGEMDWRYLGDDSQVLLTPETYTGGQWVSLASRIEHVNDDNFYPGYAWIYLDGLQQAALYIRDVQITRIQNDETAIENESFLNEEVVLPPEPEPLWISHNTVTLIPDGYRRVTSNQRVVKWESSDVSKVYVEADSSLGYTSENFGQIIGISPGTATVTATGVRGEKATILVTVLPAPVGTEKKYLALTFDDGPTAVTPGLLDVLRDEEVTVTFFTTGGNNTGDPAYDYLLNRERDEGHDIGNHSWSHSCLSLDQRSYEDFKLEIDSTQSKVQSVTSGDPVTPVFIRAPALFYYPNFLEAAKDSGLAFIGGELTYDCGGRDPNPERGHDSSIGWSPEKIAAETLRVARPWGIIINHDYGESSGSIAEAMSIAIPQLKAMGYEIVSLSKMLQARGLNGLEAGKIYDNIGDVAPDAGFTAAKVESVTVSPASLSLSTDQTGQLSAIVKPSKVLDTSVIWSSDNELVATVDSRGKVTAVGHGEATITAATNGVNSAGIHLTASAAVYVAEEIDKYWHGFLIPGTEQNYSFAEWEIYESYTAPGETVVYNDVLKLIPPAGGYRKIGTFAAMPLSYDLAEGGDYELSMKVWVEPGSPADIVLYGFTPDLVQDFILAEERNVPGGTWLSIYGHVSTDKGITVGLIGIGFTDDRGLNNATIYIRDLVLKRNGEIIESSTPNEETPIEDSGVPTDNWHGLKLIGEADKSVMLNDNGDIRSRYDRYYSGAEAFYYESFDAPDGMTYEDVLKVVPPVGGYEKGMALIYDLPGYGNYTFTMTVWLESGKEGNIHWQYLGNDDDLFPENNTHGQWVTLSSSVVHKYYDGSDGTRPTYFQNPDAEFIYLLGASGNFGLLKSTIYIRDLKVEWDGIDITNVDTPFVPQGITLEWDDDDFGILEQSITINVGHSITLTPKGSFDSFEWKIDGNVVSTAASYEFYGTAAGTKKVLLWVEKNGELKGASITIHVE